MVTPTPTPNQLPTVLGVGSSAIEAAAVAMFYQQVGLKPPYPLWDDADAVEKDNCRNDAQLAYDAMAPFIAAQAKGEALAPILSLHRPEKRWTTPDYAGSFDSGEEAAELDESDDGPNVDYFEICAECGRIERDWAEDHAEEWTYKLAMWPCKTAAAVLP